MIAREYASLKEAAKRRCANQEELDVVQKAFDFANEAHKGVRRRSGEPYIIHPIEVAKIVVSDIGLGYKSIVAALLHDVVEDTEYTSEDIRNLFGDKYSSHSTTTCALFSSNSPTVCTTAAPSSSCRSTRETRF